MKENKQKTLDRLARLEGQVRSIPKMVQDDRYCVAKRIIFAAIAGISSSCT